MRRHKDAGHCDPGHCDPLLKAVALDAHIPQQMRRHKDAITTDPFRNKCEGTKMQIATDPFRNKCEGTKMQIATDPFRNKCEGTEMQHHKTTTTKLNRSTRLDGRNASKSLDSNSF
jgi:hypothetical protein